MNKKNGRLSPLQILAIAVVLVVVAIYRLVSPSTNTRQGSIPPAGAASQAETGPVQDTALPQEQNNPPIPTVKVVQDSNPSTAMNAFDYFVLSLSWSPDYCASNGNQDIQQCSIGKKLGFVLHGLWPQNNQGYPSNCSIQKLSQDVKIQFSGLYPNDSLLDHEWEKHGTCTGLSPAQYFSLSRQIKQSVAIPDDFKAPPSPLRTTSDQLKQAFMDINPGMTSDSLAVHCSSSGRYLSELDICFSRAGETTTCSTDVIKNAAQSCENNDFLVRNSR